MALARGQYVTVKSLALGFLLLISIAGGIGVIFPPHIYPVAVVVGLLALIFMIYSPIAALLAYLVFFLAWPQEWAPYFQYLPPFTERIVGFVAMGSVAISMLVKQRSTFYLGRVGYASIGLMAAFSVTAFTAYYLTEVKDTLFEVLRLFVVFILVVNICDTPKKLRAVVWLYMLAIGLMVVMSVVNYYNGIIWFRMGIARALGLGLSYADPNSHAATIVYCLPVMFYAWRQNPSRVQKIVIGALGLLGCWNIILTGSRTAMLGVLFLAGAIILRSRRKLLYGALAAVLLVGAFLVMPHQYKERFESTTDLTSEASAAESARGRIEGLEHGLKLFMKSPLTGVGAGCYQIARGQEFGVYFSAHNMLGELMAETGIVGMTAFGVFVWAIFATIRRNRRHLDALADSEDHRFMRDLNDGLLVGFLLLFMIGLGSHNLYRYNWFFFGALVTVIGRLLGNESRSAQDSAPPPDSARPALEESPEEMPS